jgi:putative PIG3 family NAD(P)H quinone oxidoreductase
LKAILLKGFGDRDQLFIGTTEKPKPSEEEVLVKVEAAALNRADILQRKGQYPPPPGASDILGMEIAGEVVETGSGAVELMGIRVMALLPGGGYAQYVTVNKHLVLPVPDSLTPEQAAGVMEAFLTGWQALKWLGKLSSGEMVMIHAGASGVGSACIQLAKILETRVINTASDGKLEFCKKIGADICIDYNREKFDEVVKKQFPDGVDLVIDFIGGPYFQQNLAILGIDGRMVTLGFLGGVSMKDTNLAPLLSKRLTIMGSTLRSRSLEYRGALVKDFKQHLYDHLKRGTLTPIIDKVFPWEEVQQAHQYMESNQNRGKVILRIGNK